MSRMSKLFVASLVLMIAAGVAMADIPPVNTQPKVPKVKNLEKTSDDNADSTLIRPTIGAVQAAPIVPPIQTNSGGTGGGNRAGGLASFSGSSIGGAAAAKRDSVEKSLRRLSENLR